MLCNHIHDGKFSGNFCLLTEIQIPLSISLGICIIQHRFTVYTVKMKAQYEQTGSY